MDFFPYIAVNDAKVAIPKYTSHNRTPALALAGGRIRTALGLHPELAASRRHELRLFHDLLPNAEYIGEVGLDGSPSHRDTLPMQAEVLQRYSTPAPLRAAGRSLSTVVAPPRCYSTSWSSSHSPALSFSTGFPPSLRLSSAPPAWDAGSQLGRA